ncbi:hypothetical protein MAR_014436 [Mya arenaria]|uniref:Uncharacterized protein n=1 Tax=Mya arenaria TaxID=6604 RepID=A0ABY7G2Q4_MYAAR|nr:hypothetical protein MAR_014436 [Mya arenaria]
MCTILLFKHTNKPQFKGQNIFIMGCSNMRVSAVVEHKNTTRTKMLAFDWPSAYLRATLAMLFRNGNAIVKTTYLLETICLDILNDRRQLKRVAENGVVKKRFLAIFSPESTSSHDLYDFTREIFTSKNIATGYI